MDCAYPHLVYDTQFKFGILFESLLQLIGSLISKCDNQNRRGLCSLKQVQHTFNYYACLSSSRTCIDYQGLFFTVFNGFALILIKLDFKRNFLNPTIILLYLSFKIKLTCQVVSFTVNQIQSQNIIPDESVQVVPYYFQCHLLFLGCEILNKKHFIGFSSQYLG